MDRTGKTRTPTKTASYVTVFRRECVANCFPLHYHSSPWVQRATVDHVVDTTGRADDDVDAALAAAENPLVLTNVGSSDAGVAGHAHVVPKGHHHLLNLKGLENKTVGK